MNPTNSQPSESPASRAILVSGWGVVSPAGWGIDPFREALAKGERLPTKELTRPSATEPLTVRRVPRNPPRPAFLTHARLRRASPISHHAVGAALEALGPDAVRVEQSNERLGVILCVMSGCVNYSSRFYDETLRDPAIASPLVFPETVFNAPSSHIAAVLGTTAMNYTLVGDQGTFLVGLALAAEWLVNERVDRCLVIGAEEVDWLTADAFNLFARNAVLSEGAGALCLTRDSILNSSIVLAGVTSPYLFLSTPDRFRAAQAARDELPPCRPNELLCDSQQHLRKLDAPEEAAWDDWIEARLSPKKILGESFAASSAWQCVAAVDALGQSAYSAANVSVVGSNQQAIAARFISVNANSQ